jgi:hypothetical protein
MQNAQSAIHQFSFESALTDLKIGRRAVLLPAPKISSEGAFFSRRTPGPPPFSSMNAI